MIDLINAEWIKFASPAANYMQVIEERQGLKVCCPEEIAYRHGFIDGIQLEKLAAPLKKSGYGEYLLNLLTH